MKDFSLFSLITTGLVLAGCTGNQSQLTHLSELEDPPFQEALESRVEEEVVETKIGRKKALSTDSGQIGQNGFKDDEDTPEETSAETDPKDGTVVGVITVVDVIIKPRSQPVADEGKPATGQGDDCLCKESEEKKVASTDKKGRRGRKHGEKRDIHFYIGNAPGFCLNTFAKNTYQKGFLSHLNDLNWWFSHSLFSAGENPPGYLEYDGRYLNSSRRTHKRRWEGLTVLHKGVQFYEDVFSYTVTPFVDGGGSFYLNHTSSARDSMITYDAPHRTAANKGGKDDPLAGLNDLLTEGYDVMRADTLADVFIVTNQFPDYTPEEIDAFLKTHANLRIHNLLPSPTIFKKTKLGSLKDLVEKTKGTSNHLCSNKNIGPTLAEIVADKNWTEKQKAVQQTARDKKKNCSC